MFLKIFFSIIKLNLSKALIFGLKDEDGNVISKKEDIEVAYCNFYINIYQVREETREQTKLKKRVKLIPRKF